MKPIFLFLAAFVFSTASQARIHSEDFTCNEIRQMTLEAGPEGLAMLNFFDLVYARSQPKDMHCNTVTLSAVTLNHFMSAVPTSLIVAQGIDLKGDEIRAALTDKALKIFPFF